MSVLLSLFPQPPGQTLRGLKLIIYLVICLMSDPKTQSVNEWDLELLSGADFWCNLHHFSSRDRSRGTRGPQGAENRPKNPGPDLSFILPKVCPTASRCAGPQHGPGQLGRHGRRGRGRGRGLRGLAPEPRGGALAAARV